MYKKKSYRDSTVLLYKILQAMNNFWGRNKVPRIGRQPAEYVDLAPHIQFAAEMNAAPHPYIAIHPKWVDYVTTTHSTERHTAFENEEAVLT